MSAVESNENKTCIEHPDHDQLIGSSFAAFGPLGLEEEVVGFLVNDDKMSPEIESTEVFYDEERTFWWLLFEGVVLGKYSLVLKDRKGKVVATVANLRADPTGVELDYPTEPVVSSSFGAYGFSDAEPPITVRTMTNDDDCTVYEASRFYTRPHNDNQQFFAMAFVNVPVSGNKDDTYTLDVKHQGGEPAGGLSYIVVGA